MVDNGVFCYMRRSQSSRNELPPSNTSLDLKQKHVLLFHPRLYHSNNVNIHWDQKAGDAYFGNTSVCSLVQPILWCWWVGGGVRQEQDLQSGWKCMFLFNMSRPECVTLMCTNLSNTEINEAPAHPHSIHLCGWVRRLQPSHICGMLMSLVDLLVCRQTERCLLSHLLSALGVTSGQAARPVVNLIRRQQDHFQVYTNMR